MKHHIFKAIALLLTVSFCLSVSGCRKNAFSNENENNFSRINGKNLYYISEQEKSTWKEPLTKMMKKAFLAWEERQASSAFECTDGYDETAIADSYGCGLLDVTMDGFPELLIYPFGYSGSSGTVTYFVYDIKSSQYLGALNGGNGDTFCLYYDIETEYPVMIVQYWLRYGWSEQEYFVDTISYSPEKSEYENHSYFQSHYQAVTEHTQETDDNGNIIDVYDEAYSKALCYIDGKKVSSEEYHSQYARFLAEYIRIPETALVFIPWNRISAEQDSRDEKIEKMITALIGSEQKFLKP